MRLFGIVNHPTPTYYVQTLLICLFCNHFCLDSAYKAEFGNRKICIGTNGRMSVPSNRDHHYRNLRDRYLNCTYVDGNLELTWLQDENFDLSFLQYIREVTGYVLISHVDVKRIALPRLQIIRGRSLFKMSVSPQEFSLIVTLSKMFTLELPALRDILHGSVGLLNNYNLCHVKTINWKEIITDKNATYEYQYDFTSPERACPPCDRGCEAGCWGEGAHNCQKFSKENCSPQCYEGRCFGPKPRECCHLFCAGGCTGPKQSDCLACRNFYDNGVCTQECPPMQRYNPATYSWEKNPDGKYAYGATCVKKCPEHLLKDDGACVRNCPEKKKAVNGECVMCDGACPKRCKGVGTIHSGNIDYFKDCTVIEGSIQILDQSFKGYQEIFMNYSFGEKYEAMHPDRLEVFSSLREVTEFINIQGSHEDFKNLSYFRNLETIGGRTLTDAYFSSLYIVKTSLQSLGLRSLKRINTGSIVMLENKALCFAEDIDWSDIKRSKEYEVIVKENRNRTLCKRDGFVCDAQCSRKGCWGTGNDQCLSCGHFKFENICLQDCDAMSGLYKSGPKTCDRCHEQCGATCRGPGAEHCDVCQSVRDGPFCVSKCPNAKYAENGVCKSCHKNCVDGCTGPLNTVATNGCNSCEKAIINVDFTVRECLSKDEECPDGYFLELVQPHVQGNLAPLANKVICRQCHPRCKKCTGFGIHQEVCKECTGYKRGELCEDDCPIDHYADNSTHTCIQCHTECRRCFGPDSHSCRKCRNFKLFTDGTLLGASLGEDVSVVDLDNNELPIAELEQEKQLMSMLERRFQCVATCPIEQPYKHFPEDNLDPFCSEEPPQTSSRIDNGDTSALIVSVFICAGLLVLVFLGCVVVQWRRNTLAKESTMKMTMQLTGLEDNEPLRPTNVQPNLTKLRIIKEAELRKGGLLGYGAFGSVYKGVWVPEGENAKVPVAIKVLRESNSGGANTSKEFLEEAYIMACVEHPNLLQLLAVCMTNQIMLVTQLMPLGCLLDFVRNNRDRIGSKALLNWSTQIARGMAYLEEKRLVHRDLAARNVLVQTPRVIKITDFGLAKLLDINEDEYKAAGGKMPIKWLALECIQHRIFTHKSDVWAFGVTMWEIFTFGGKPYDNVLARDVPELLERGERLQQPDICTIDVYMLMLKCWVLDAESRPSFKELAENFDKMSRDPGRYLVIDGDRFRRYNQQENRNPLPNITSVETSDLSTTDGEEYLQPKSRAPIHFSSTNDSPPLTPSAKKPPATSNAWPLVNQWSLARGGGHNNVHTTTTSSEEGAYGPNPLAISQNDSEMLKYATLGTSGASDHDSVDNQDGVSVTRMHRFNGPNSAELEKALAASNKRREAQLGTLKLDLPLDDDDYLMPSPQQSCANGMTGYMDLIGDGTNSRHPSVTSTAQYSNYNPSSMSQYSGAGGGDFLDSPLAKEFANSPFRRSSTIAYNNFPMFTPSQVNTLRRSEYGARNRGNAKAIDVLKNVDNPEYLMNDECDGGERRHSDDGVNSNPGVIVQQIGIPTVDVTDETKRRSSVNFSIKSPTLSGQFAGFFNEEQPGQFGGNFESNFNSHFSSNASFEHFDNDKSSPKDAVTFTPHFTSTNEESSVNNNNNVLSPQSSYSSTVGSDVGFAVTQGQNQAPDESDHEYYNDLDRLKRELQPLRKNETTV